MQETKPSGGSRRVRSNDDSFRVYDFPSLDEPLVLPLSSGTAVERERRQVAAGFLAVAGVVVVSQWNSLKSALGLGSSDHSLIQAVNEDTRHLRVIRDHVMEVEKVTRAMRTSLAYTKRYENLEDQFDKLVTLLQEVFGQYQFVYAGIDQLIFSHRLNSALVHPPYAIRALTSLSKALRRDHKDLLIEGYKDLYKMDTSYVLFGNFTMDLYVHIPIGDHSATLTLYEFVPAPIRLASHPQLFSVHPYRIHIAVGDSRQVNYKELAGKDLRACRVVRNQYYCPHQTVLGFDHAESCLSALSWGEETAIFKTCPLKPIPHQDYYVQIAPTQFIVAIDELEPIRFSCNRSSFATIKLEGILRVTVPSGCQFEGKVLTLSPTSEIHFDGGVVMSVPVNAARDAELKMLEFATNSSI